MLRSITLLAILLLPVPILGVPVKDKSTPLPDYRGSTNWGEVSQEIEKLTFTGHFDWFASGTVRKNGTVYLHWIGKHGERGHSVYELKDGKLIGKWALEKNCEMKDGELVPLEDCFLLDDTITWQEERK